MRPPPERVAIHQAGHAVVQTLVGRGRFCVNRVSMEECDGDVWRGKPTVGESRLDREVLLGLYEFGLVTLAGIAAENRYLSRMAPQEEPLVAVSDLVAWREQAWEVLQDDGKVDLVGHNVMLKLEEWLAEPGVWGVVDAIAGKLLAGETLEGESLRQMLLPLGR